MRNDKSIFSVTELQKEVLDAERRATQETLITLAKIVFILGGDSPEMSDALRLTYFEQVKKLRKRQLAMQEMSACEIPDYMKHWRGKKLRTLR